MWYNTVTKYIGLRPSQLIMLLGDALIMQVALFMVAMLRLLWGPVPLHLYATISSLLWCMPLFSILFGACQIPLPPPHREVKHIFLSISMTYLIVLLALFLGQSSIEYSRAILFLSWSCSLFAVPMLRGVVRRRLCKKNWWGCPTIFFQDMELCQDLWDEMLQYPERGLKPVAYLNIASDDVDWEEKVQHAQKTYANPMFVWCGADEELHENTVMFEKLTKMCRNMLFIPCGIVMQKKFWLAPRVLGTSIGFVVRQNLTDTRRLCVKRSIDVIFSILSLSIIIPLSICIYIWIWASTGSNPIYTQERWGQGGKKIRIYKFRTMIPNAEEVLVQYLRGHPELQEEWDRHQKLIHDPRITSVGKLLRKTSLDELPQIINVIKGDMSLVGPRPRPIVEIEIKRYGDIYIEYSSVRPGITGLWQISGRSTTTYEQRIWYDNYYVSNWSIWMDLWIMARTIPVVLRGYGAC